MKEWEERDSRMRAVVADFNMVVSLCACAILVMMAGVASFSDYFKNLKNGELKQAHLKP